MTSEPHAGRRDGKSGIPLFKVFMPETVLAPLRDVLFSGWVGEGPRVAELERALQPWLGTEQVLALSSGSGAIQLALKLAGVGPGDRVVTTPLTCIAMNHAILHAGARPVWADLDPATGNVDPADVARKVDGRTRALMVVHWGGDPCELQPLGEVAAAHGIPVIEDAGHAFGARYDGAPIGSHSAFVCFSFQAIKVLTTVDGGALACRRPFDAERGRRLRWYGIDRKERRHKGIDHDGSDILEAGYKLHMNDVTAVIGLEQLRSVAARIEAARAHARRYDEAFGGLASVRLLARHPRRESSHWLYTLRVKDVEGFRSHMAGAGIEVSKVHVRNDRYAVFRDVQAELPGVDAFTAEHVCIPVGWWLSDADVQAVVDAVAAYDVARRAPVVAVGAAGAAGAGGAS